MGPDEESDVNDKAYCQLKPLIDAKYPKGWLVAIDEGRIVADGANFDEVEEALTAQGRNSPEVLVVEAGDDTPDYVDILIQETVR